MNSDNASEGSQNSFVIASRRRKGEANRQYSGNIGAKLKNSMHDKAVVMPK